LSPQRDIIFPLSISSILSFPYGHPVAAYVFFLVFPFFYFSVYIATGMTFFCKNEDTNIKQITEDLLNNKRNSGNKVYKLEVNVVTVLLSILK